jgi:hypothetical protein
MRKAGTAQQEPQPDTDSTWPLSKFGFVPGNRRRERV